MSARSSSPSPSVSVPPPGPADQFSPAPASVGAVTATRAPDPALMQIATQSLARLREAIASGRPLTPKDDAWLGPLQSALGVEHVTLSHPQDIHRSVTLDARLDRDYLNQLGTVALEALADALTAMLAATAYQPAWKRLGDYAIPVHNDQVSALLRERYSSASFAQLFDACDTHGVFQVKIDEATGIGQTTEISEAEDDIMSQRWVTDAVRFGDIQNVRSARTRVQALETVSHFYEKAKGAFERVMENPQAYHDDDQVGVPHIFTPTTLDPFPWLCPKRLESHGEALAAFCQAIVAGAVKGDAWGVTDPSDAMVHAIERLVAMFEAIDYSAAPSNGVWEELAPKKGLTSDIALVAEGLEAFRDLVFNPAYNDNTSVKRVRESFRQSPYAALLNDESRMTALIERGRTVVRARLMSKIPVENPDRNGDSGLVFAATLNIPLSENPLESVRRYLDVLDYLEKALVRPYGMIKYEPFDVRASDGRYYRTYDSYLSPNWGLAADGEGRLSLQRFRFQDEFGYPISHVEPSNEDRFLTRSRYAKDGKPAEWSFVLSEMARAYCVQMASLLNVLEAPGHEVTDEERALLQRVEQKATEYVNRSFAQVTGDGTAPGTGIKANGKSAKAWAIPEAYQHVSTFRKVSGSVTERETAMLPGVNTPLGWSTGTLFAVSQLFASNLKRRELGAGLSKFPNCP